MSRKTATVIILIICSVYALTPSIFPATQISGKERKQKLTNKHYEEVSAKEEAIQKELHSLKNHPWAGEYHVSDALTGKTIFVAPKAGFSFLWNCCMGPCDINYGAVDFEGGRVVTKSILPNRRDSFQGVDSAFYPILWGDRHYLIAEDEMLDFCNSINAGFEPADGNGFFGSHFLIKTGDEKKPTSGPPPIPEQYREYVLAKPINAQIVSIDSNHIEEDELGPNFKKRITVVTFDAGYLDGVRPGMSFYTVAKNISQDAEVTQVFQHSCKAETSMFLESETRPAVGWQLSTRVFSQP